MDDVKESAHASPRNAASSCLVVEATVGVSGSRTKSQVSAVPIRQRTTATQVEPAIDAVNESPLACSSANAQLRNGLLWRGTCPLLQPRQSLYGSVGDDEVAGGVDAPAVAYGGQLLGQGPAVGAVGAIVFGAGPLQGHAVGVVADGADRGYVLVG